MNLTKDSLYKNLALRAEVIGAVRQFFNKRGFLEVETPVRSPSIIPEAHIETLEAEKWFLQASPELCMKRLISRGFINIYQLARVFRKNERGKRHLPEFTMLEWYSHPSSYLDLMDHCRELFKFIAVKLNNHNKLEYQGRVIDLSFEWEKLTVEEAFDKFGSMSLKKAIEKDKFEEILSFEIEPNLGNTAPCFLYDYPSILASLAKLSPDNDTVAQRFELYVSGIELANGFSELSDPLEQKLRFEKENQIRAQKGKAIISNPEKFLEDLSKMPEETAGIALGVDRLVMLFCNASSIDEVVAFIPESL